MHSLTSIPIASTSALAFYVTLLVLIVSPAFRGWLGTRLDMPEPSTHSYLGPLNAFRGMAALYVACFHAWQWPQPVFDATASMLPFIKAGAKAVPMFVILSGLLIYRSLRNLNSVEDFRLYLRRRFLRIFPLYGTTMLAIVLLQRYPYASFPFQHYIADAFMLRSLNFPGFINPPAWSLYVEIAFYLLLPAYVIAVGERTLSVTIVAALLFAMTDVFGPRELMLWKYFCIGVLVCLAVERWRGRVTEQWAVGLFAAGMVLMAADVGRHFDWFSLLIGRFMSLAGISYQARPVDPDFTVGLGVAEAFIVFGAVCSKRLSRLFSIKPFHVLGVISYSIFMWHSFIITADLPIVFDGRGAPLVAHSLPQWRASPYVIPLVTVPAIIFWSMLSYIYIERPFLMRRPRATISDGTVRAGLQEAEVKRSA